MQGLSDEQLIAIYSDPSESLGRQNDAVNQLFTRYQTRVALWCYRVAGDRDWARDLAQEVFLRALRNLEQFRGESKFSTWLYIIARNHCFNAVQSRSARPEEPIEFLDLPDTGTGSVENNLELAGEIGSMRDLLRRTLDDTEREVMTLHYGEELTLGAITNLLGLRNASGAKAYIVSARRKLERAIERVRASARSREGRA
jgi:RNA polymerase sigma-70 factor (ECF subfamily)